MQSCLIVGSENETTSGELGGHVRMLSIPTSLDQPAEVYGPMRVLEKWSMLFIGKENKL